MLFCFPALLRGLYDGITALAHTLGMPLFRQRRYFRGAKCRIQCSFISKDGSFARIEMENEHTKIANQNDLIYWKYYPVTYGRSNTRP